MIAVRPGDAANLLEGWRAGWDPNDSCSTPYQRPPHSPFRSFDCKIEEPRGAEWEAPQVSLHSDAESLIGAIEDSKILPVHHGETGFSVPLGALSLRDEDSQRALGGFGASLGLDLSAERCYLLVKARRVDGEAAHEVLSSRARKPFDRLKH